MSLVSKQLKPWQKKPPLKKPLVKNTNDHFGDGPHTGNQVTLHFQDISLRHSDVQLLQHYQSLNERLIKFYLAYLEHRRYRGETELHFLTPALTQRLRHLNLRDLRRLVREHGLREKNFIFLPLANAGHWSLMLISRPDCKIYYFDSLDGRHMSQARLLYESVRLPLGGAEYRFVVGRCLQQETAQPNTESGVHLICMLDSLTDYVMRCGYATSSLLISVDEVKGMRAILVQLIQSLGGILPTSPNNC